MKNQLLRLFQLTADWGSLAGGNGPAPVGGNGLQLSRQGNIKTNIYNPGFIVPECVGRGVNSGSLRQGSLSTHVFIAWLSSRHRVSGIGGGEPGRAQET